MTSSSVHSSCFEDDTPAARDTTSCVHVPSQAAQTVVPLKKRFAQCKNFIARNDVYFSEQNVIGEGAISFVFRGELKGNTVAVKVLRTEVEDGEGLPCFADDLADELDVVSLDLNHPHIMKFYGAGTTLRFNVEVPMIVYELMSGSIDDLFERKRKQNNTAIWKPSSKVSLSWCRQLLEAVSFLHNFEVPLAHRDIKPANLLVSEDMLTLKLADFSLATPIQRHPTEGDVLGAAPSIAGSLRYMAPEVMQASSYDLAKADVYSCALTCWTMIHGQRPLASIPDPHVAHLLSTQGVRPPVKRNEVGEILTRAWDASAAARPSAETMCVELSAAERRKTSSWGRSILRKVATSLAPRPLAVK